ncbi:MAG: hypothetical protein KAG61_04060 [Bacteriovoracaceae bacterium]|nr:hypothetical protein [Bacteriovoracaceae bacterium]
MKNFIVVFIIVFLSANAIAGDGSDGGGSKHSILEQLLKGKVTQYNPIYSEKSNKGNTTHIHINEDNFREINVLEVDQFYFLNDQIVNISDVKVFLMNEDSTREGLKDIKLNDILGIVAGDKLLLLRDLKWIDLKDERGVK